MTLPSRVSHALLLWLVAWLPLSLVGCVTREVNRDFSQPELLPFSTGGEADMPDRWWTEFADPGLNSYMEQAVGDNFDLATALQRLRAAQAVTRREASDLLPDIDGFLGTDITFGPGPEQESISWGLDAAYQVDLWGQIQSRVEAERFRAEATRADYHAVALALAAEVTRTWYSLVEAHAQLELLNKQIADNRTGVEYQESRFANGQSDAADVYRQRQLVESTLEQAVVVRARVEVLEHQLAVLLGEMPQAASYEPGADLPNLPPLPSVGLPSELLARRPDVRRDYLAFVAADRDLASAISAQYPRLNLTGSIINAANGTETLFRGWFLSIGGQLVAPLFDGGQRRAEVDRTSALVCQRFNEYGQTMLIAFQEVEDNLALERYQVQRIERLESQVDFAKQAAERLLNRLTIGDVGYLDYLSATQAEQRLQREILSARLDLILIRIGLYLALAGDFDTRPNPRVEFPPEQELVKSAAEDAFHHPPQFDSMLIERLPPLEPVLEIDE